MYKIQIIRNFAARLGFPITYIPAGIHQVNVSESLSKIINAGIRSYANKDLSNWDNILPILVVAINSSIQKTGFSAIQTLYGNATNRYPGHFDPLLCDEHLLRDFEKQRIVKRTAILQKRHKLFQTQAKTYNRGRIQPSFKAGDLVFVYNKPFSKTVPAKFLPKYRTGVIVRQVSPLIYDVKHYFKRKFRTRRVHLQMLKPRFTLPRRLETQTDLYNTVTLHDIGPDDFEPSK